MMMVLPEGKKDGLYMISEVDFCPMEIFFDFFHGTYFKGWAVFIDHAEGAFIVWTADCCLYKKAVCLTWWSIYRSFIA
jgi:hypothetical protein